MTELWRQVREAYYEAVRKWAAGDKKESILWLRVAVRRTWVLIEELSKEG